MANKKEMDKLFSQIEFELTPRQRFSLFKHLYTVYGIDDTIKIEKHIIKEIANSTDIIEDYMAADVEKACKTILKSYKHFKNRL